MAEFAEHSQCVRSVLFCMPPRKLSATKAKGKTDSAGAPAAAAADPVLLSAGEDGALVAYRRSGDAWAVRNRQRTEHELGGVLALALSHSTDLLASAGFDGAVCLYLTKNIFKPNFMCVSAIICCYSY